MGVGSKGTLAVLSVILAIFAVFTLRFLFVVPPAVDPSSPFDTGRAVERLTRILGDEQPHPVDSDANDAVRQRLLVEIRSLGFEPMVRDDFYCNTRTSLVCARVRNVLFWVTAPGPDAVMIASHYDSVPPGPGAADDGSGVAASLEIAAVLRGRDLERPVLVLMTDGEEGGLIGAGSFVANDPIAAQIGAVVSMEARGVRGTSSLIQTSRPNGRDIEALSGPTRLPVASSLNADIYELLPNDTDVTMYLDLGVDAANLAFADGAAYYHTPYDTMANLDHRTLFHQGVSGLRAVEVFAGQDSQAPEGQFIYTDILGLFALALPQSWSVVIVALGLLAALFLFVKAPNGAPLRTLIAPPLALILGLSFAIGVTMLIAMLRPETSFGGAHPWALRATHNAAALLGGVIVYALLLRPGSGLRMVAAGWIWFGLAAIAAVLLLPGAGILFVPALVVLVAAALLVTFRLVGAARMVALAAALLYAVIVLPLSAGGEVGLFIENAAPFAFAPLFLFIFAAPLLWPSGGLEAGGRALVISAAAAVLVLSAGAALIVPAYNIAAPQSLSILHVAGQAPGEATWAIRDREPLPGDMADLFNFTPGDLAALAGNWVVAPAPDLETRGVSVSVIRDEVVGDERVVEWDIAAPDADRLLLPLEAASTVRSLAINDETIATELDEFQNLICYGRACRSIKLTFRLSATEPASDLTLIALTHGLGAESRALIDARPPWAVPQHWGDLRVVTVPLVLQAEAAD